MKTPNCPGEDSRLEALEQYGILDTPREEEFDQITHLARHICDTPVAIISLVTADRQWFKSRVGLDADESPLDVSICVHAILESDLLVVPDTTEDPRFSNSPLVIGDPYYRFYAGAQLRTPDGYALGTLCVLDTRPRQLTEHQLQALRMLADQVMHLLELRRTLNRQAQTTTRLQQRIEAHHTNRRMVSHDLRSPLTAVHLAAQQLTIDPDEETTAQIARHVLKATEKMNILIDELLGDTPESVITSDRCSPVHLVDEIIELFRLPAKNADIDLKVRIEEALSLVRCDPHRTFQVLNNLVSNAIKFSSPGATVTITVRHFGHEMLFEVEDTGPGIPEGELDYVFETRWRSPSVTQEGSGLGLAIARQLVQGQGGRIGVESTLGEGTAFWFTLPRISRRPSQRR